jgi:hypothetical protein
MKFSLKLRGSELDRLEEEIAALLHSPSNSCVPKCSGDKADPSSAPLATSGTSPVMSPTSSSTAHLPTIDPTDSQAGTATPKQSPTDSPSSTAHSVGLRQDVVTATAGSVSDEQLQGEIAEESMSGEGVRGSGIYDPPPPDKFGKKGATRAFPAGTGHYW